MKSKSAAKPSTSAPADSRATYPSATVRTSSPRARLRGSSTGTTKAGSVTTRRTPIPGSAATSSARERGAPQGTLAPLVPLSGAELHFKARPLLSHRLELGPGRLGLQPLLFVRRGIAVLRRRRSEEHTSELQSQSNLVCRLLLEKKKKKNNKNNATFKLELYIDSSSDV